LLTLLSQSTKLYTYIPTVFTYPLCLLGEKKISVICVCKAESLCEVLDCALSLSLSQRVTPQPPQPAPQPLKRLIGLLSALREGGVRDCDGNGSVGTAAVAVVAVEEAAAAGGGLWYLVGMRWRPPLPLRFRGPLA